MGKNMEFNGNVSGWDTSSVTTMKNIFQGASSFNSDISGWDTSSVTTMKSTFEGATSFNIDIRGWNVKNVGSFERMFEHADSFYFDLCSWVNTCKERPGFNDSSTSWSDRSEPLKAAVDDV